VAVEIVVVVVVAVEIVVVALELVETVGRSGSYHVVVAAIAYIADIVAVAWLLAVACFVLGDVLILAGV
jgi:hypothetical protein